MSFEPLTGGCLCGQVRYRVTAPPSTAIYCHCTRCQRRAGVAAAVSAMIGPGTLEIVEGEELVRCFVPPDGSPKCFCSACGSGLWSVDRDTNQPKGVRMGTFDGDPGVRPSLHQFVASAASWEALPDDGLPRFAERPPG